MHKQIRIPIVIKKIEICLTIRNLIFVFIYKKRKYVAFFFWEIIIIEGKKGIFIVMLIIHSTVIKNEKVKNTSNFNIPYKLR